MLCSTLLRRLAAVACCVTVLGLAGTAQAQQNSLFGGGGPSTGSSGFGTGTTGSSFGVGTGSGMMSSAFPGSSTSGTMGVGGVGAGSGMNTGFGQGQTGMGQQGMGQQRTGLVGQSNQRFVGNSQAGQQQPGSQLNRQGQNRNLGNRRTGQQNPNQQNQGTAANNPALGRSIRPQLVVAFSPPRATVQKSAGALSNRLDKLSNRAGLEGVTVETEGNTLILRGQVGSADAKRLASTLARLEPGVRSVRNDLTVKAPAPAAQ